MTQRVIISLHDITPYHYPRIKKAVEFLLQRQVIKVSFFCIPHYHNLNGSRDFSHEDKFKLWLDEWSDLNIEWVLHGYYHAEGWMPDSTRKSILGSLKNKLMTDKEGEFQFLSEAEIGLRIQKGRKIMFQNYGKSPNMFVAPAWLYNKYLIPQLKLHGFDLTENYRSVLLLTQNKVFNYPVITWATRSFFRRMTSTLGCPVLKRLFKHRDTIRIALHPNDFDYPLIQKSIDLILQDILENRIPIHYQDLL